jgi:hypothetical protein
VVEGEARGPSWRGRIRGVEGENKRGWSRVVKFVNSPERPEQGELSSFIHLLLHPPTVWALDLPRIHHINVTRGLVCIKFMTARGCINHRCINSYNRQIFYLFSSVADADPGSGAFLTPGSGIQNRFFPDPGSRTHIFESLLTIFWVKSSIIL